MTPQEEANGASAPTVSRRWRDESLGRGADDRIDGGADQRLRRVFVLLSVMLALIGTTVGLLSWLHPVPQPYFVPLWIDEYQSPLMPSRTRGRQVIVDRETLLAGRYFPRLDTEALTSQERPLLVAQLNKLRGLADYERVIVYLCAYARCARGAEIDVLPADADPDDARTWLPLHDVLAALADCPARHKLLVLDIMHPLADATLGVLANDIAAHVETALDAVPDPRRLTLCSCSPGQIALSSENMRHSIFGYYLIQGLNGWADGWNPRRERDGRVSVRELSTFVRARVGRWVRNTRDSRQTPMLLGEADDWELLALEHGNTKPTPPRPEIAVYPAWLHDGWKLRDRWRDDGSWQLDPRTYRRLEATVLRAEQRWRGQYDPDRIQSDLRDQLARLEKEMDQARRAIPRPSSVHSLALASLTRPTDQTLIDDLKNLLLQIETRTQGLKANAADEVKSKLIAAFLESIKNRPMLDLAQAVFASAAADPSPRPERIRLLWHLLATRQPEPMHVETVFLRRLADLAEQMQATGWPREIVHHALVVVADGEKAVSQATILPWIRPMLDEADRDRQGAQARFWARGYASLDDADRLLKRAADRYRVILSLADKVQQTMRRLDEAMAFLPAGADNLDLVPQWKKSWLNAVETTLELQTLLASPLSPWGEADKRTGDAEAGRIQQAVEMLWLKSEVLQSILDELRWPLRPENLTHLGQLAVRPNPSPALRLQIRAILNTPYLRADERAALWRTGREAARRRHEKTLRLDREEDRDGRATPEPEQETAEHAHEMTKEYRRALDRGRDSIALLRLGGLAPAPLQALEKARENLQRALVSKENVAAASWAFGDALRRAWSEQVPTQLEQTDDPRARSRLAWVVPPLVPLAVLDDPATNPRIQLTAREAVNLWTRLADRYLHDYQEAVALDAPRYVTSFYLETAHDHRQVARPIPDQYLRLRRGPPPLPLEVANPTATYTLPLDLSESPNLKPPVNLAIVTADDDWLEVTAERTRLGDQPDTATPTRSWVVPLFIRLKANAAASATPMPKGFLIEASANGRSYHFPISLSLLRAADRLDVLLSASAERPTEFLGDLRLRPVQARQPIYLYLRNPSGKDRKILVRLTANNMPVPGGEVTIDLPAQATQRVAFPLPVAAAATAPIPPSLSPKAGENGGSEGVAAAALAELSEPLQVEVLDTANANAVLAQRVIRVAIAQPREYVRVAGIHFDPGDPATKRKNRLSVRVAPRGTSPGPPDVVTLTLPPDRIPGLLGVGAGNFRGVLPPLLSPSSSKDAADRGRGGAELTLFAEGIHLSEGADEEGYVYLGVDSSPRAMIFRTTFARQGSPATPQEDDRPALRLRAARYVRPTDALAVTAETDNAPAGAHLELSLGHQRGDNFTPEIARRFPTARRQHIGFSPHGPGGALLFEASIQDWTDKLDIREVRGESFLRARLLDRDGNEVRTAFLRVTVQGDAPDLARFVHPPKQALPAAKLTLRATGHDSASGISKVFFFVGKPADDKAPKDVARFPGLKTDADIWSAQVPLPFGRKGLVDLSVQFINGVGRSRFDTVSVEVVDRLAVLPGKIQGKITEGALPQAGIAVALVNERGTEKSNTTTKEDGSFVFDKLAPGKYKLSALKDATQRKAETIVTVTADKTTTTTMDLYR